MSELQDEMFTVDGEVVNVSKTLDRIKADKDIVNVLKIMSTTVTTVFETNGMFFNAGYKDAIDFLLGRTEVINLQKEDK